MGELPSNRVDRLETRLLELRRELEAFAHRVVKKVEAIEARIGRVEAEIQGAPRAPGRKFKEAQ